MQVNQNTYLQIKKDNDQAFKKFDTWALRIGDSAENSVNVSKENLWKINNPIQEKMKSFLETL